MDMAAFGLEHPRNFCTYGVWRWSARLAGPCSSVVLLFTALCLVANHNAAAETRLGIYNPLHAYDTRAVDDRFSRFLSAWDAGQKPDIDTSSDLSFLRS